ncbi:hypothetical protein OHT57_12080 [Streptomyces sp. NBC_00285]|uniref:hypothetical protein n=1 Tax=Streptomyces sp. NBC_00285 TaxID=2975700 RepID=UPI002E2C97A5|nr:hypothetical protein [Streptomyces sp. NBC_00285]
MRVRQTALTTDLSGRTRDLSGRTRIPAHARTRDADLVRSRNAGTREQTGGLSDGGPADLLAVCHTHGSGSGRELTADVGRTPTLHSKFDSAEAADREVAHGAGAGRTP